MYTQKSFKQINVIQIWTQNKERERNLKKFVLLLIRGIKCWKF